MNMQEAMQKLGVVQVIVDPASGQNILVSRDGKKYSETAVAKWAQDKAAMQTSKENRAGAGYRTIAEKTPDAVLAAGEGFQKGSALTDTFDQREGPEIAHPVASTIGRAVGAGAQILGGAGAVQGAYRGVQAARAANAAAKAANVARGAEGASALGEGAGAVGRTVKSKAEDLFDFLRSKMKRRPDTPDVPRRTGSDRLKDIPEGGPRKLTKKEMAARKADDKLINKQPTVKSRELSDRIGREQTRDFKRNIDPNEIMRRAKERRALEEAEDRVLEGGIRQSEYRKNLSPDAKKWKELQKGGW